MESKYVRLESSLSALALTTKRYSVIPGAGCLVMGNVKEDIFFDEVKLSKSLIDAREDARRFILESEFAYHPRANLVIGLTFYEDWYSTIPKEMRFKNIYEWGSAISALNDKDADGNFDRSPSAEALSGNISLPVVPHQQIQTQSFYASSSETSVENDGGVFSVFNVRGLQSLLPIRFPSSEDMVDLISSYERSFDDTYKKAVKHLQFAFESPSAVSEVALRPLIQLLLLGGRIKEALFVVDKSCSHQVNKPEPLRLRAYLWECFHPNDTDKLPTYLEELLMKDARCSYYLEKLVSLHQKGDYAIESLVDMLALHLDAAYPDYNTWREFASCLLKIFHREEDIASVCKDGDEVDSVEGFARSYKKIPELFERGHSKKTWKLRCRWWVNRHFGRNTLASEMSVGKLQLMTYKAASASYLYGKECEYVTKVEIHLNQHDKSLLTSLHLLQIQNSIDLQSYFFRK